MEIEILKKEKNELLGREGIEAKVAYSDATPSRKEMRKELAKKIGKKEDLVIVSQIKTYFGSGHAKIYARAYDNEKDLKATEIESMIKRHDKGKKGQQAPAEGADEPQPEAKEEKSE